MKWDLTRNQSLPINHGTQPPLERTYYVMLHFGSNIGSVTRELAIENGPRSSEDRPNSLTHHCLMTTIDKPTSRHSNIHLTLYATLTDCYQE